MTNFDQTSGQPLTDTPRIYVACLSSYNSGKLHGAWIDATQSPDDIQFKIDMMLKASPEPDASESSIHDFEHFLGFSLNEYDSIQHVSEIANFIVEHGKIGAEVLSYFDGDIEKAEDMFERYIGCYTSVADWAEEFTEETTQIPENLIYYIDYTSMARDIEMGGDIITFELGFKEVHIFWSR